jgi:peptidyl-prolyl cis-trans isomerase SurA
VLQAEDKGRRRGGDIVMIRQKMGEVIKVIGTYGAGVSILAAMVLIPQMAATEIVERIVAVVNEEIITLSEVRAISIPYLKKMETQYSVQYGEKEMVETEKRIVDQLIDEKLVAQEADRLGVEVTPKELEMAVRDVKERNQFSDAQFEKALAEDGMTLEDYKKELTRQMKKMRVMDQEIRAKVQVSKKEVDEYYEKHKSEFNAPPEVRLQQILLVVAPEATDSEINQVRKQADQIHERVIEGEDFTEMVKRYSQDVTAAAGGDMGVFLQGELFPALDEAAFSLKVGEVSGVIQSPRGFHILRLLDKKDKKKMTEEERSEEIDDIIYNRKVEEKFEKWIKELREKSYVLVNL